MAAQCPVMDEGGGGDFPRGRLAPGSYDLSRALLSFCWAPLQSHSLQRLLSWSWGQGLNNVCMCVGGWQAAPLPQGHSGARDHNLLYGHVAAPWCYGEEDQVVVCLPGCHQHPGAALCDRVGRGAHLFIRSFTWRFHYMPTRHVFSF